MVRFSASLFLVCGLACFASRAVAGWVNYDEAKVPAYTLPDPLISSNREPIRDAATWRQKRRGEILELFRTHVYGRSPGRPPRMAFRVSALDPNALGGRATRKTVSVRFTDAADGPGMELVAYLPSGTERPVPVFVGVNLFGTRAEYPMPGEPLGLENLPGKKLAEVIVERGYGFATIHAADLAPDSKEDFAKGVIGYYSNSRQTKREPDAWGAIGAWAWGLSRAMDYFETDAAVDSRRVVVIGHSRMGKTALWAGAQDERFAMVISNNSGCGGAALSRRRFGETVAIINRAFPYWFCENFKRYNGNEDALPVDQHMLVALIAPRPVYIASAERDRWADPRGEFLAGLHAEPVYRLLGKAGLGVSEMPAVNRPVGEAIGYHIRSGKHDLTDYDWVRYLDFADGRLLRVK